jgi:hypothetical protein
MDVLATVKWRSFYRTLKIYFDGGKIPLSAELSPANMDVVRASVVLRQGHRWVWSSFGGEFKASLVAPFNSPE